MLDAFRGGFTDQGAIVAPHVVDNGFIKAVAADANRRGVNYPIQ